MFIHWGIYSELGGVWNGEPVTVGYSEQIQSHGKIPKDEYQAVAERFNPVNWNADEIVDLAVTAGMQYIVITAKHHDGFNMYHTKESAYNIVDATPFGRDILKELEEACRRKGVKLGLYFSQIDWALPGAAPLSGSNSDPIPPHHEEFSVKQLHELLTGYGDICEVWFDMGAPTPAQSQRFRDTVKNLQPQTLVSGRVWNNQGDFIVTGDNDVPDYKLEGAWQVPATIREGTWGYRSWLPLEPRDETVRAKVRDLTKIIARGGNYLLNIGPKGDGSVLPFEREVLLGVGDWLRAYGESVFGCEPNPFDTIPAFGDVAAKPGKLFLFVRDWPQDGKLELTGLQNKVTSATALGAGTALAFTQEAGRVGVQVPAESWDAVLPVVEVAYEGDLDVRPTKVTPLAADRPTPLTDELATDYYSMSGPYYGTYKRTTIRREWLVQPEQDGNYVLTMNCRLKQAGHHETEHSRKTLKLQIAGLCFRFEPEETVRIEGIALPGGEISRLAITLAEPEYAQEDLHIELDSAVLSMDS